MNRGQWLLEAPGDMTNVSEPNFQFCQTVPGLSHRARTKGLRPRQIQVIPLCNYGYLGIEITLKSKI